MTRRKDDKRKTLNEVRRVVEEAEDPGELDKVMAFLDKAIRANDFPIPFVPAFEDYDRETINKGLYIVYVTVNGEDFRAVDGTKPTEEQELEISKRIFFMAFENNCMRLEEEDGGQLTRRKNEKRKPEGGAFGEAQRIVRETARKAAETSGEVMKIHAAAAAIGQIITGVWNKDPGAMCGDMERELFKVFGRDTINNTLRSMYVSMRLGYAKTLDNADLTISDTTEEEREGIENYLFSLAFMNNCMKHELKEWTKEEE